MSRNLFRTMIASSSTSKQHHHDGPRPQFVLDSITIEPRSVNRNGQTDAVVSDGRRAEQLLCDHATLLLSIAGIAQSEITHCPTALEEENSNDVEIKAPHHRRRITPSSLPTFPKQLGGGAQVAGLKPNLSLLPRSDSLRHSMLFGSPPQPRYRSVSFDSPTSVTKNILQPWESTIPSDTKSPLSPKNCRTPRLGDEQELDTTPKRSNQSHALHQSRHKKSRLESPRKCAMDHGRNKKVLPRHIQEVSSPRITWSSSVNHHPQHNTPPMITGISCSNLPAPQLQGTPPEGTTVRKVFRRKFSWKNYPQVRCCGSRSFWRIMDYLSINISLCYNLCPSFFSKLEEFLISNRDSYLRHSALNYTIEQKNYNNTLTRDLLSLATKYGYMFDPTDFTFVTVRDRIRCYYKSYVQSAKKRGILMGYAAKKAGLLPITTTMTHHHENDDDDEMKHNWSDNDSDSIETH